MMAGDHGLALGLPRLADSIPFEYRVPGDSGICAPLALALLESPALGDTMFSLGPNALLADVFADLHERDLATRALTNWWTDVQRRYPTNMFKWTLLVSELDDLPDSRWNRGHDLPPGKYAWFCLSRDEKANIPRVSLARAAEELEKSLEGFGQTVIAVLEDAVSYLPECLTLWRAHHAAQWLHWHETENDDDLIALARENQEDPADLLTRAIFFESMPTWAVAPQRTVTRKQIVRAAREGFERQVISACDAISKLVNRPDFNVNTFECGTQTAGYDSVEGMLVISWREGDTPGDVIDDMLNHIGQGGDYVHFIDMRRIELRADAVAEWMRRTENMVHLAQLTERLLNLIGDPF